MKMTPQQYCLRWKHHHSNVQNMFAQLLEKERFCDVTLYCSPSVASHKEAENVRGVSLRAHRVVLAACSELLGTLLGAHEAHGEPVLVIDGADPKHVKALLDYMYTGEMNVHHSQLASLLKTAEELRIKGLTDIRWNNKDEPPDCQAGNNIVTTTFKQISPERKQEKQSEPKIVARSPSPEAKRTSPAAKQASPAAKQASPVAKQASPVAKAMKTEAEEVKSGDKCNVNGGPPPLIKLPTKDKGSPMKREHSDTESPSPKRQRHTSANDNSDNDSISLKTERDPEWQHGNMDISAERVVGWGAGSEGGWSREDDDDWADAPTDIGSFLHTNLRVDGDNSADEESCESTAARAQTSSTSTSASAASNVAGDKLELVFSPIPRTTTGPKSGPNDPRFKDVVKLNDYLQNHGRRPHFWEENYVKRVMESVRLKELEMKQAAEILGVSYGTLYGRYRDVYGCINRPYRTARDFWQAKGPSEVLERLQRGEITLDTAAVTLGVSSANLAAYVADVPVTDNDFEPIPIEVDPSLQMKARPVTRAKYSKPQQTPRRAQDESDVTLPAAIAPYDAPPQQASATPAPGKWPTIRVASLETLRADTPASPSALMRTRPDLTIVAAKKPDKADEAT